MNLEMKPKKFRRSPKAATDVFARRVLPFLEAAFVISYSVVAFILYNFNMG